MKDIELPFSGNLSWPHHGKKRAETAIKTLYFLKGNISKDTFVDRKNVKLSCCSSRQLRIVLMDALQIRTKSNRNCAAESCSLDTGTKCPHLQGEISYPGYFTSLIIPRPPGNPINC